MASYSTIEISAASSSTGQIVDLPSLAQPFKARVLFLGNRYVGKASLVGKLNEECRNRGNQFIFERVAVELPNNITLSNFAPTHTQRDGRMALRMNFPESHGVVLVYDVSNRQSYDALKQWYKKIEHQVDKYNFKIVIGNKVDVHEGLRQVTTAEGQQFASSIGWAFLEASAKTSLHITDVISLVVLPKQTATSETRVSSNGNVLGESPSARSSFFHRVTRKLRSGRHSAVVDDLPPAEVEHHVSSLIDSSSYFSADDSINSNFENDTFENVDIETKSNSEDPSDLQAEDEDKISLECVIEQIRDKLSSVMADEEQKQILFCQRGPSAQSLLDLFHMLLDHPGTNSALRSGLMVGTKHLCYRSSLYPRSFILKDIRWEERTLYAGGFGDILKGWFKDQEVCLKVVKVYANYDNDRLIRAFSKEAILWSHISHPNTLPFYGIFKHPYFESRICLVSPWMANGNINEYLRAHPEVNRHPLICDIAEGVKYLHQNGIIHGDLKGFNILINVYGRACIGDFGLSTIVNGLGLSGQWTSVATSIVTGGTLRWQAPELLNVDFPHVTKMSDIYAFACVCYEILTGKIPFYNILRDGPVILKIITGDRPSRPDDGSISDCIWELMELCWCQEPCERPQMEEVVDSLRVCPSVEKQEEESWGTLSSSSIRLAMHGPMKQMTAGELKEILSWL